MNVMTTITAPAGPIGFSTADFWRMMESGAFEDMWVELIGGEIQRMPPPGNAHGALQIDVIAQLLSLFGKMRVRAEAGIDLGEATVVGCDAAVLRAPVDQPGWLAPDQVLVAVNIAVSTRDRDLGLKRRLYAAAGVPTYWVVDAERAVIHVFDRPERDDYLGLALVRFGEPLPVPGTDAAITIE